jgi:hypothetical protein
MLPHLLLLLLLLRLLHCSSCLLCQLLLLNPRRYLHQHLHLQHQLCWQSPGLQQPLSLHHLLLLLQVLPSPVTPMHLHAPLHL